MLIFDNCKLLNSIGNYWGAVAPPAPHVPTPIHYQSVSIMLQSDYMMYKAVFSYMYNSA